MTEKEQSKTEEKKTYYCSIKERKSIFIFDQKRQNIPPLTSLLIEDKYYYQYIQSSITKIGSKEQKSQTIPRLTTQNHVERERDHYLFHDLK